MIPEEIYRGVMEACDDGERHQVSVWLRDGEVTVYIDGEKRPK